MATLSLADELVLDEDGSGLVVEAEPGVAGRRPGRRRPEPHRPRPRGVRPHCGGPPDEADPLGRWARGRLGRRGGRAALGRVHGSGGGGAPGVRRALLPGGRPSPGARGWGSGSPRCPSRPASTCCCCRRSASTPPRVYRAWDADPRDEAPNALAAAALAVEPRLARWRDALGDLAGSEPALAGSGSTWFVERGPAEAGTAAKARAAARGGHGPAGAGPYGAGGLGGGLRGPGRRRRGEPGTTCRPGAASGWPSASSCASSCASACGAS